MTPILHKLTIADNMTEWSVGRHGRVKVPTGRLTNNKPWVEFCNTVCYKSRECQPEAN